MNFFKTLLLSVFCLVSVQLTSQSATCYAVSENASDNELYTFDPVTGMWSYTGQTCTDNIEAIAYDPFNDILYATNRDVLGTIDITSGSPTAGKFTPKSTLGTVNGDYDFDGVNDDVLDISDVDGLSYDPVTGILWASDRLGGIGSPDILFAIDIATCQIIQDQFGPGQDYVTIPPVNDPVTGTALWDIDDIAWDPFTGRIYMIQNQSGVSDVLTYYDINTNTTTIIGSISPANDMEGLGFNHLQQLFGTTGNAGGNGFFLIDATDGSTTLLSNISTVDVDFESVDCLTTWSDLALDKKISSTQPMPIASGDQVCFDIEVYNQGQVDNYNIELTDYIPTGLTLNDANWVSSPPDANFIIAGPLLPGTSIVVPICFTVNAGFSGVVTNTAEISGSEDEVGNELPDIDSVPDDINDETGVVDNEINENGPLYNEDEDDHDIANITIVEAPDCVASSNSPICEGQNLSLAESGGDATMWAWSGPNGFTSSNQNPSINSVTAAASGTYVVTVTSVDGATSECDVNVTVSPAPVLTIDPAGPFCEGDPAETLVANPTGGIWSGNGITDTTAGTFDPSIAGTGTHTITYNYTDAFGCSATESIDIEVNPIPVITFPVPGPFCENDAAETLSAMPAGGTYSGPGMSGADFDPATAGAGTHTVSYTFTDANGCENSVNVQIVVNPLPTVTIDPAGPFCVSDNPQNLTGSPSGGSFSGAGITDGTSGTFDPSVAGVGTHTITYLFTDGNGCTAMSTVDIVVTQEPEVTIDPAGPYCIDDVTANLVASPVGGMWSGTGITSASTGAFNPGVAGVGAHTITYEFVDASGCEGGATIEIIVHALPAVDLEPAGPFCVTDASMDLMGTPVGGTFAGNGITDTANGTFDPATAGVGTHTITYIYTDANGCSGEAMIDIVVNDTPTASITPAGPFCIDDADEDLVGNPVGGLWSGMGISNSIAGTFSPSAAGVGTHTVSYTFIDPNGCSVIVTTDVVVNPLPTITPGAAMCSADLLSYDIDIMTTGDAVTTTVGTVVDNGGGSFDIVDIPTGSNIIITSTDSSTGCSSEMAITSPDCDCSPVTAPNMIMSGSVCQGVANPELSVSVDAGLTADWWDMLTGGNLVATNSLTFTSTETAPGMYTYYVEAKDPATGCVSSPRIPVELTIFPNPVVGLDPSGPFCINDAEVTLMAMPTGGEFSGMGITDASAGTFDPATSGSGTSTVTYTYIDANGCENSATTDIVVNPLPVVSIEDAGPYCVEEDADLLIATPAGGTWTGMGITDANAGQFDPSVAGVGTHTISYMFRDANGCEATGTIDIMVTDAPTVEITEAGPYCIDEESLDLVATPTGGTWAGTGITDPNQGTFSPGGAGVGTHTITYTYSDGAGCEGTAMIDIVVNPLPSLMITPAGPFCPNDVPFQLTGTPMGGIWSGPGIADANVGEFDPAAAGPGTHTITYAFVDPNGCEFEVEEEIVVYPITTIDLPAFGPFCETDLPEDLGGASFPGMWSGMGITDAVIGTFDPAVAGVGVHTINYMLVDENGCEWMDAVDLEVLPIPTISADAVSCSADLLTYNIMVTTDSDVLSSTSGTILDNGGGSWTVSDISIGTSVTLTTSFSGSTCATTLVVNAPDCNCADVNAPVDPNNPSICEGEDINELMVTVGAGEHVDWYDAASGGNLLASSTLTYTPTIASVSGTYTYYAEAVDDATDCVSSTRTPVVLQINALPIVSADPAGPFCLSGGTMDLTGSPVGGVWSGTGIVDGAAGTFDPADAGVGAHSVTYTYTDANGCEATASVTIDVNPLPTVTAEPAGPICSTDGSITLVGSPVGGTWSGVGVDPSGILDPAMASVGVLPYTYVFVDENGCTATAVIMVEILSGPNVTADIIASSCAGSDGVIDLTSTGASPFTYAWNDGTTTEDRTGLASGTYIVIVTDVNGCETEEEYEIIEGDCQYDLAIDKVITSAGPYAPGSTVTYAVTIENEGTLDAANVTFTDVPQTGLVYVMSDAGTLANVTESSPLVFDVASLPVGATEVVTLTFTIDAAFTGTSLVNDVSITADDGDDVDSDPSTDDTVDEDGDGNPDDDDEAEVEILIGQVYDLAIDKVITSTGPYASGSTVTYAVTIENEGTIDAANVTFTDVPQTGLVYVMSDASTLANVTESSALVFDVASLPVGATETVTLTFTIDAAFAGTSLVNDVSITADDGDDVDSDPSTDDTVDEDGDGNPDDDDEAEVEIVVEQLVYDLAIDKVITSTGPYAPGSTVTYAVTIENEGTIDAANVTFTDVPQTGLVYVMSDASTLANVTESSALVFDVASLPVGVTETVTLTFTIDAAFAGTSLVNDVSITADDGDDVDSDPSTDDTVDEDGDGNPDDDDEAEVEILIGQVYDLAIDKVITSTGPYASGSTVTYAVTIENEGTMDAANITFTDVPQTGLVYVMSDAGTLANVTESSPLVFDVASLPVGATEVVTLTFTIDAAFTGTSLVNDVSITADDGDDVDSDPSTDDTVDEDGDGNPDDDDEAEVEIVVEQLVYDLAIDKIITSAGPYAPGSTVTYAVTIENEGTLDAANVTFTDVPQTGLVYVMSDTGTLANVTESSPLVFDVASLPVGATEVVTLTFTIDAAFMGTSLVNDVSITADDGDDVDSDPATDDTVDEDGDGNPDDDDEAEVAITVDQLVYDLAIDKVITSAGPYAPGSTVTYAVTIENEGTMDAANVTFTDVPQTGLVYVMSDAGTLANVTESSPLVFDVASLPVGATEVVTLTFTIDAAFTGTSLVNDVSITADDGDDVDSDPSTDDTVDEDGDGNPDDDDEAEVEITVEQLVYDLALTKMIDAIATPGPFVPGDIVTFEICVENQGDIAATNVEVTDYIPAGMTFSSSADFVLVGTDYAATIASIAIGATECVSIDLQIDASFTGSSIVNDSEITADDGDDNDSTPGDNTTPNDLANDNDSADTGGGDDQDPAEVQVQEPGCDAESGTLVGGPFEFCVGDGEPDFIPASAITASGASGTNMQWVITDSNGAILGLPPSFDVVDFDAAGIGTCLVWYIAYEDGLTGLMAGENLSGLSGCYDLSNMIEVIRVEPDGGLLEGGPFEFCVGDGSPDFIAADEITLSGASGTNLQWIVTDANGSILGLPPSIDVVDFDDAGLGTCIIYYIAYEDGLTGLTAGSNLDDLTGCFDLSNAIEVARIVCDYDLAIDKVITSAGPYAPGSTVTYEVEIENEGTMDAANVTFTDVPQTGLVYVMSDAGTLANVTESSPLVFDVASLPVGATEVVTLTFTIDAAFAGTSLVNDVSITADDGDDIDSDPATDDTVDEDGDGNPDDDDEAEVEIMIGQVYDLAISKTITSVGPYAPGSMVSYNLTIENQGTVDAANIEVIDLPDAALVYTMSDAAGNANVTEVATLEFLIASLAAGSTETINVLFTIDPAFTGTSIQNYTEIIADDGDDVDSDPDTDNTVDEDGDGNGDDDDEDVVELPVEQLIYDLAIDKVITSAGPYAPGSTVTYEVTIENEGTVDAANVTFTDVPQTGLIYVMSDASGNANITESSPLVFDVASLPVGATETVILSFMIDPAFTGTSLVNDVSITADDGDDVDSDPSTDDTVDEDGDGDTDDDDEAEVEITLEQSYDLAIDKVVISAGPYSSGSTVTYMVTLENEGSIDANNVTFVDVPEAGLVYVMSDASGNTNVTESSPLVFDVASLPVGATETVMLSFTIDMSFAGTILANDVSITADDGDDVDSDPSTDDTVDEDGDGNPDDDDEAEATIVLGSIYDLAIDKVVTSVGPYTQGSTVTYQLTLENQGSIDAANIQFLDTPQPGLVYVMSDAASNANVSEPTQAGFIAASLPAGSTETVTLTFTISPTFTGSSLLNKVEIVVDDGDDVDSDPMMDDTVDEDGDGNPDDDDEAEALITLQEEYDLALFKVVTTPGPYVPGQNINYGILVTNQGDVDANNVVFTDIIPSDLIYVSSDAATNPDVNETSPLVFEIPSLPVGATSGVVLTFQIDPNFAGGAIVNDAMITADDGDDIDSDPATDDSVDEDGDGDPSDDDESEVTIVVESYDLAITKTEVSTGPYAPGSTVSFALTLENQGTITATNVLITDIPQAGLNYMSSDAASNPNVFENPNIEFGILSLAPGATETINVSFTIDPAFTGTSLFNDVLITEDDGDDVDSDPDTDNTVDEDGDGNGYDDDEDQAEIVLGQTYDLAITKSITSAGPYAPGSVVTYSLAVENQGTTDAANIEVIDLPDAGLVYTMSDASSNANVTEVATLEFLIANLAAGSTETINVSFTIDAAFTGTSLENYTEIIADDGDDLDSDPNTDNTVDEDGDGNPDDDDEDLVIINLEMTYDLALDKAIVSTGPYSAGSTVMYTVTIENEGDIAANNILFTDNPSTGLNYVMSDASANANVTEISSTMFEVISLAPGATETVTLSFVIDAAFTGSSLTNAAEIIADDGDDVDSDPMTDDTVDEDGDGNGDDDDEDQESILVGQVYDLALTKVETSSAPYSAGDPVTFAITVENQGSMDAMNIQVTDSPMAGLIYVMSDASANANVNETGALIFDVINLPAGATEIINVSFTIDPTFTGSSLTNNAEITADDGDDIDSDPMTSDMVDEDGDGNGDDDDEDAATIIVGQVYDLAIDKVTVSAGPYSPGSTVSYDITITNEGVVDAANIQFVDSAQAGLTYGWSDAASNANVTESSPLVFDVATLLAGQSETVNVTFTIDATFTGASLDNSVQITSDDGDDIDSDPSTDNTVDEDGDGNGDDDDEDVETISVGQLYDLALTKQVTSAGPYMPGSTVTYAITVENQGMIAANNIQVMDMSAAGLNYVMSDASTNGNVNETLAQLFEVVSLAPGATETVNLSFTIDASFTGTSLSNDAMIVADDGDDADSDPNTDATVDEDGDGNGDDDDEDATTIMIGQIYDLAIDKTVTSTGPYATGSIVSYSITVTNEGTLAAANIQVTEAPQTGLNFQMSDAATNANVNELSPTLFEILSLAGGATEVINVDFIVDATFAGSSLDNAAMISLDDGDDIDSNPDTDAAIDEDGDGNGDDDDEAIVTITIDQVFDLSLEKMLTSPAGSFGVFDDVEFTIAVNNDGTLPAFNVGVVDYIPTGFMLSPNDTNGWTLDANGDAHNTIAGPIAPGTSETVNILVRVTQEAYLLGLTTIENVAEIENAENADGSAAVDIDSDPDGTEGNDPVDEDDTDPEMIELKELDPLGYIYCEKTGQVITGGLITVTGPGNVTFGIDASGTTLNGSNGFYQFFVDAAGVYDISFAHPNGYPLSTTCTPLASPFDPSNVDGTALDKDGLVNNVIVMGSDATGGYLNDFSCGFNSYFMSVDLQPNDPPLINLNNIPVSCVVISGTVCEDTDSNGMGDATDPGRDGMTVNLFDCADPTTVIATTQTANGGQYSFEGLVAGCYQVQFDIPAGFGVLPGGFVDLNGSSAETTLNWGECIVDGDFCISQVGSLGDFVWKDLNGDGLQSAGEPGVEGVIVNLFDCAGTPAGTTTTDVNGAYGFDGLIPGSYRVQFDLANLPVGCVFTTPNVGSDQLDSDADSNGNTTCVDVTAGTNNPDLDAGLVPLGKVGDFVWNDCNGNGIQDAGEPGVQGIQVLLKSSNGVTVNIQYTDASGLYLFENINPGLYYVEFVLPFDYDFTLPHLGSSLLTDSDVVNINGNNTGSTSIINVKAGDCDLNIGDAGIFTCVPIGDQVWYDINENNIMDANENGLNGIRVNLYRLMPGGYVLWDYQHTDLKPGTPSDDGYYKFCAPPGTYYVEFVEPPLGLVPAMPGIGGEETDSDITGSNGQATTDSFTVTCGQDVYDLDAGFHPMGTIGDFAFMDQNQNGLREPSEPGVSNVIVEAYDNTGTLMGMDITDQNGQFKIDYLQQRDVFLKFIPPSNLASTLPNMGAENIDSDIDNSNGYMTTAFYDIQSGEHQANVDAGFIFGAVAVDWLDFVGENRGQYNWLEWTVTNEINVSHYEVERSINGTGDFTTIDKLLSINSSEAIKSYSLRDFDISEAGLYYYRIKQVDLNGEFDYSKIITIDIARDESLRFKASIYPNPTIDNFTLDVEIATEGQDLGYEIFDFTGKKVRTLVIVDSDLSIGKHMTKVDVTDLSPGVYTLKIRSGVHSTNKKFIVIDN